LAGQYQQTPAPAGGGMVKEAWFRRYRPEERPARFDQVVQSWDTANKPSELADYSVCTTWGVKGPHFYLLNILRKKLDFPNLKRAVREQADLFSTTTILDRRQGVRDATDPGPHRRGPFARHAIQARRRQGHAPARPNRNHRERLDRLPVDERPPVLNEALDSALSLETVSGLERRDLLARIFDVWKAIGFAGLEDGRKRLSGILRTLDANPRGEFLNDLGTVLPVISEIGGPDAIVGTYESVRRLPVVAVNLTRPRPAVRNSRMHQREVRSSNPLCSTRKS
jgi:hypothetical protein